MKFTPSAHGIDRLLLTRWEVIKLFFGFRLYVRGGTALDITCRRK